MSFTRAQLIANTREMMDAVSSNRWSDAFVSTVLGIVSGGEWQGILAANPMYRFAQRSVTADSSGQFTYAGLSSGSGDSAQNFHKILAITDGNSVVYRQITFQEVPLATTSQAGQIIDGLWYDAGSVVQIIPAGSVSLTVSVNYTPPRVSGLSADSVAADFPSGHESILWLETAAYLLSKGGAENDAAQTMRAMAEVERQAMYQEIQRRAAEPMFLRFPDRSHEWAG